jgi:hypothetical protein
MEGLRQWVSGRHPSICNLGGARAERKHESHPAARCIVLTVECKICSNNISVRRHGSRWGCAVRVNFVG